MFERVRPKTLKKWLIIAALVYLISPFDLIPDFLGIPGRIDDLTLMGVLAWFYAKHARQYLQTRSQQQAAGAKSRHHSPDAAETPRSLDAYEVLGIGRTASRTEIRDAYRARMQEYHPDKVAHLGSELQKLAHEKCLDIQHAYQQLRA